MGTHPIGVFGRHPTTDMGDDRVCVWGGGGGVMLRDRCDMIQHAQPKAHRCCTLASISSADLPEAQMMKMCPNLAS